MTKVFDQKLPSLGFFICLKPSVIWKGLGLACLLASRTLAWAQALPPTGAPHDDFRAITCSADGTRLVAATARWPGDPLAGVGFKHGAIYTSGDAGITWVHAPSTDYPWVSVASSGDGTKLVAVAALTFITTTNYWAHQDIGGVIFTSTNSGATWAQTTAPSYSWSSVASSADGRTLVAAAGAYVGGTGIPAGGWGPIYFSTNFGASWVKANAPSGSWTSVASSASGAKVVAAYPGWIYTSADFGATWSLSDAPGGSWNSVACSADGTTLLAVAPTDERAVYASVDGGATWSWIFPRDGSSWSWSSIASSADGNTWVAASNDGGVYVSTDSGGEWTVQYNWGCCSDQWRSLALSADGRRGAAAGNGLIYIWPFSQSWKVARAPVQYYSGVASSMDGVEAVASGGDGLYTSADSGATWSLRDSAVAANALASSANGTRLMAAANHFDPNTRTTTGWIYISTNSGATWLPTNFSTNYWAAVAESADGAKLAAAGGSIYISSDAGATWTLATAPSNSTLAWSGIACSSDGTKLVAVDQGPYLFRSADSGSSWAQITVATPDDQLVCVASSGDGTRLVAAGNSFVYVSADSAATWMPQTNLPVSFWSAVACSADGTKLAALDSELSVIYVSTDSGATWKPANAPSDPLVNLALSGNGSNLIAAGTLGLYVSAIPLPSFQPPAPRLMAAPMDGSLRLSWPVPSASFALQQNLDLSSPSWTNVETLPTLNFTNLHYDVSVPASSGSGFYRLTQR